MLATGERWHVKLDPRDAIRIVLGGLLALVALNAFAGGYYGLAGAKDVPPEWLEGSPFSNYFIPSLFLFAVIGGFLAVAATAVFARWRNARALALAAGVLVLTWLAVQVMILGYVSWMQPATAIVALLILVLATRVSMPTPANMLTIADAATQFLKQKRIGVTGVSRDGSSHGANVVYQRLRERGYRVFAVNPNAKEVEGDPAYPNLRSIPGGVDAVLIGTRPENAESTMRECVELGIEYVWMHRSVDKGSVSDAATAYGRQHGVIVIDGGCPLMFAPVADPAHKAMKFVLTLTGKVPRHCA